MTTNCSKLRVASVRLPHRATSMLALAFAAALTGGCKHFDDETRVAGWSLIEPTQRHPILVSQQPETLNLVVGPGSDGLNPAQRAELLHFSRRSKSADAGNSRLVIAVPSGSENEVSAMAASEDVRTLLVENGFDESGITVEPYPGTHAEAPVRVSFMRYVAEGPSCRNFSENLAVSPQNLPAPDLGCATQRNLAAMVANPGDLLGPRTSTARASDRRDVVWGKYIKGEPTDSARSENESAKITGN